MPHYYYKALKENGEMAEGSIEAFSIQMARAKLTQQKLKIDTIILTKNKSGETSSVEASNPPVEKPLKSLTSESLAEPKKPLNRNMAEISQRITDLAVSRLPLTTGLLAIAENHPDKKFKNSVKSIVNNLEKGQSLDEVLSKHGFSEDFLAIIKASIYSNDVDKTIYRYIRDQNRSDILIKKFLKSVYYPLTILVFSMLILIFLFQVIIPQFKKIFDDFGSDLPDLTWFVIGLSDFTVQYLYVILIMAGIAILGIFYLTKSVSRPGLANSIIQKMPFCGRVFRTPAITRFCYSLSAFIEHKVSLSDSFRLAGSASQDHNFVEEAKLIASNIEKGSSVTESITRHELFPPLFLQLMQWEDHPEFLAESLRTVCEMEEIRAEGRISVIAPLIEPLALILLGGAVGLIILSLFLPLIQLMNDLS